VATRRYPNVLLQSFVTGQLASELLRRELEPVGMTPNQFAVQSMIRARGPLTPTALAALLGMAAPTLSAWIKRLQAGGQIRKLPHPTDGRSYLVEATEQGAEELEAAYPGFGSALTRLEQELGADLDAVWQGGVTFEAALRAALESPSDLK
jgi:DNA-binding MarR family transcriptional regulator